ncbi:protein translocase subunit SecF [Propionimicrobium sp. PCR01-08-3]|uniref:protein translocase subunit SecF n=1 Tax=Propionimicrobium sp. PCR01-08-3 TaxID=3052086 RepID=UPI00255CBBFE|nr:protein translocase subunit SecF [Propionimicrobium sp. PCR01-08-3]WIY83878.1 protein translocase subunit SecF [Propionimicrobium sp. PCR01-08-3]
MSEATKTAASKKTTFAHRLYTGDFQFDFMTHRRRWYTFSAVLLLISVLAVSVRGLNLGIEFVGGSVFQAPTQVNSQTIDDFARAANDSEVAELDTQVNTVGDQTVRIQTRSLDNDEVIQVREAVAEQAGIDSDDVAYSLVGPSWGKQITQQAVVALVVFLALVGVLIWAYFREWKMSVSALVALLHDLIVTVGLYALAGFSVTPATVIAVLTILGYSLYDTVVVFDMVREQTKDLKNQSRTYTQAANAAVNQVLVRSINTTIIAVLPVLAILVAGLVVLGGEGPLADLGLAMLIGMIAGAYSSIFLATPMLAQLREREPAMIKHRKALEKAQRRGKTKVVATLASAAEDVSPTSVPLAAAPAGGVLEFASDDTESPDEVPSASSEDDNQGEGEPADHDGEARPRVQPSKKKPRSARKK